MTKKNWLIFVHLHGNKKNIQNLVYKIAFESTSETCLSYEVKSYSSLYNACMLTVSRHCHKFQVTKPKEGANMNVEMKIFQQRKGSSMQEKVW